MKAGVIGTEERVDELLSVLERDTEHIRQSLLWLNELRSFVIKRDDVSLGKLLGDIRIESDSYSANEMRRQRIREELAIVLGCDVEQVTLSRLEDVLSEEKAVEVAGKKAELRSLAEELRGEHLATVMLLLDCTRFNSALLKNVFELGKAGIVTYDSDGSTKRHSGTAFVNLRF